MKRKLLTLVLTLSILGGIAAPAVSAQSADERLSAVTAKVKAALNLDTASYPDFYGELDEAVLAPEWQLEWNGPDGHISVAATEDGKVLRYYNTANQANSFYSDAPAFPSGNRNSARAAAEAFVKKLLSSGETLSLSDQGRDRLGTTSYRFNGEILVNGLSAGLSCSISVRCADNQVVSFDRETLEGSVMGGIPSATAKVGRDAAGTALRDTLKLRLEYERKDPNAQQAVLRYLPENSDEYYVDAGSGKLVNLTTIYEAVNKNGGSMGALLNDTAAEPAAAESAADAGGTLTNAEQAGAAKLEGVLDRDALDQKAREIKALGLEPYQLSTANYTVSREEDGKVSAILRYGRQVEGSSWRRTVALDARTGELEAVSSSGWLSEDSNVTRQSNEAARQRAEAFLASQCPELFAATAFYNGSDALEKSWQLSHTFQYAQKVNGIFFPANSLYVGVDSTDGSISSYSRDYDESVTFDSPDGILTAEQALDAWLGTYDIELQYVRVPAAVDYSKPEFGEMLAGLGVNYMHTLALGYQLGHENNFTGIDAKTGAPVIPSWSSDDGTLRYDDISGHWAEAEVNGLAIMASAIRAGIFEPNRQLTQIDLIALILSCEGWHYDLQEDNAADQLYERAYDRGLLKRGERNDTLPLTRIAAVRMLLDGWGFKTAAKLNGIYRTTYTDDSSIPAADYGYAALAQGLGLASGPAFEPQSGMTRAQAAVMLYRLLSR